MSSVLLYFFRSDLVRNQLFRLRIAVKAICFSSLVNKPLGVLTMVSSRSSLVPNVSNQLCHGSIAFPIKYTFESMAYCWHFSDMLSVRV